MPPIKKLSSAHKFVVIKLMAAFESPTAIARLLAEEYSVSITPQSLYYYDPMSNESLPRLLSEMFYTERDKFLRDLDKQPMHSLAFRQAQRLKIYQATVERNPRLAREILNDASMDSYRTQSQAAKAQEGRQEDPAPANGLLPTRVEQEEFILKMLGMVPPCP